MNGTLAATVILATAMALVGLMSGLLYFRALRWTVGLLVSKDGWLRPVMLSVGRIGCAILVLTLLARVGAMALLAGFTGFLSARMIALRAVRRAG